MVPPPSWQENWFGVSSSCAMSTWMVWTPAARQELPANVQFTSRFPRAGSPHPDPNTAAAARPAIAVSGARMFLDDPPGRWTSGRPFRIQTNGPPEVHRGHGNRTPAPGVGEVGSAALHSVAAHKAALRFWRAEV